ncbi:C-C motif chemokine 19-like [Antennarius striatus]|uniref:C-C motif chemokine 19-like n=1 Tax=Antennarius striatus TaxID=241820 RepID=UPI0035ADE45F
MTSRVAALLLLGIFCVGFASAQIVSDCCLKVSRKTLPLQILDGYIIQDAGHGCEISATAFITKVGRMLCVSHPKDQEWVKKYITFLDEKKAKRQ